MHDKNGNGKRSIKSDEEVSGKRFRRNTRSSSNSILEGKLNNEMIEKITEQVSRG